MSQAFEPEDAALPRRDSNPRKELVRDQLLDIAARMFDEIGFERCSMGMIAKEVGLGRSAIYHYFRSKEEILGAIIDAEAHEPSLRLDALRITPETSATELLREVITEGIVRRLSGNARVVRLWRLEAQIPESLRQTYNGSRRKIYDYYVRCIEHGIRTGEFRPVDSHIAAFSVIGMATWSSRWYNPAGRLGVEEIADEITSFALAGLRSSGSQDQQLAAAREQLRELSTRVADLTKLLG